MAKEELIYVGIKGKVVALSRATGEERWATNLTSGLWGGGGGFVHVVLDGENLYATTQGEILCLDSATGHLRWHNELKGYGVGIASIATRRGSSSIDMAAQSVAQDESAVAATMPATQ